MCFSSSRHMLPAKNTLQDLGFLAFLKFWSFNPCPTLSVLKTKTIDHFLPRIFKVLLARHLIPRPWVTKFRSIIDCNFDLSLNFHRQGHLLSTLALRLTQRYLKLCPIYYHVYQQTFPMHPFSHTLFIRLGIPDSQVYKE